MNSSKTDFKNNQTAKSQKAAIDKAIEAVTEKITKQLSEGCAPWRKPWSSLYHALPQNLMYQNIYTGINLFLLSEFMTSPYWLTFQQIQKLKEENKTVKLRKGSKAEKVFFYRPSFYVRGTDQKRIYVYYDKDMAHYVFRNGQKVPANQDIYRSSILKYYNMFNTDDVENIANFLPEPDRKPNKAERKKKVETFIKQAQKLGQIPSISKNRKSACYIPNDDVIHMPALKKFETVDSYYQTLFHEISHGTGHTERLNRDLTGNRGARKELYSKEELIAELGGCYLCAVFGIDNDIENSASYIESWKKNIADNDRFLFIAMAKATQIVRYLLDGTDANIFKYQEEA